LLLVPILHVTILLGLFPLPQCIETFNTHLYAPFPEHQFVTSRPSIPVLITKLASNSTISTIIQKARQLKQQHAEFTKQLEADYDTRAHKRSGELQEVVNALAHWDKANDVSMIAVP